jgi:hypothetical protein
MKFSYKAFARARRELFFLKMKTLVSVDPFGSLHMA